MNEIDKWLEENKDKFFSYLSSKEEFIIQNRIQKDKNRVDTIPEIDLHGLRLCDAIKRVKTFILENIQSCDRVRIIHGKGKHSSPVLRDGIRGWLEEYRKKEKFIKDFSYERPENGGTGATIVWLLR